MRYYPLFLDISGKNILIAGAGEVGRRKAASVLKAGPALVELVDPGMDCEAVRALFSQPSLQCRARKFEAGDLDGKSLVFAATNDREVNRRIASLCAERGILCSVADEPSEGNFIVPSHFEKDGLTIALSTQGQSPALAKVLRRELEDWLGKRYSPLLMLLGRLRPLVLELDLPTEKNSALFRTIIQSSFADLIANNDRVAAEELLATLLPEPLHERMGELLHGI